MTEGVTLLIELEEDATVEYPFVTIVLRGVCGNDDVAVTVENASAFPQSKRIHFLVVLPFFQQIQVLVEDEGRNQEIV